MSARRKPMSEINVVPYIDVMLVLLVIFMATAPLLTQGVLVDLPEAPSQPITDTEKDPLVVSIREDGAVFVNLGIQDANDPALASPSTPCRTKPARSCGRGPMCPSMLRRTTAWTMDWWSA